MNTSIRTIAIRLALVGGFAGAGAAVVPGMASANGTLGCVGVVIDATANNQTLYGTGCNDTFKLNQFSNVTIHAGGGNDTVRAGFVGNGGTNYIYLEGGNDTVLNPNDKSVWVSGGSGNDRVEGSSGYDAFYGGAGTDTFVEATPGDFYDGVEVFA
jgi:Ca2+-binding RTX toxin-like protein